MKHYVIGIDPSINSTGVCVSEVGSDLNIYYIISAKATKKSVQYCKDLDHINIIPYKKEETKGVTQYWRKEQIKTRNISLVSREIAIILLYYSTNGNVIDRITMEGVSYGSVQGAAIVDLSFLNATIRQNFDGYNYYIVAPTEVKKYAVGNGNAEKDVMILSWKKLDKKIKDLPDWLKVDDLADAYFMAHYNPEFYE
jgi:Holliday junction resolvasome RuvABC endonuclease subunit